MEALQLRQRLLAQGKLLRRLDRVHRSPPCRDAMQALLLVVPYEDLQCGRGFLIAASGTSVHALPKKCSAWEQFGRLQWVLGGHGYSMPLVAAPRSCIVPHPLVVEHASRPSARTHVGDVIQHIHAIQALFRATQAATDVDS